MIEPEEKKMLKVLEHILYELREIRHELRPRMAHPAPHF
jgi:hypothetical protein